MTVPTKRPTRPRPWDPASPDAASFGRWLRRQREVRKITLREVAETTNISIRYLEALEADRFETLPAPVFAKGFLREYARYVGLDPDEVVNNYLDARQDASTEEAERTASAQRATNAARSSRRGWIWVAVVVVALAAAGFWLYRSTRRSPPPAAPAAAPSAATAPPAVTPSASVAPPASAAEAPLRVTLDFVADCWVEAKIDGQTSFSELRVQGESLQLEAQQDVVLSLSNARGVHAELNGRPLALVSGPDGSIKELRLDLASAPPLPGPRS